MFAMIQIALNVRDAYEVKEAARLLGIGSATVWRWIKKGKLIPIRIEGLKNDRVLIPRGEIERLKKEREGADAKE